MKTLILHYPKLSIIIALLGLASSGNLFSRDINAKSSKDLTLPIDIQYYMNKYVRVYELKGLRKLRQLLLIIPITPVMYCLVKIFLTEEAL